MATIETGRLAATVRRVGVVVPLLVAFCSAVSDDGYARADDWPQWRGPRRNAVSAETGLLQSWPEAGPRLLWKASELGTGYASIVVRRGRVFTIGRQGTDVVAQALDAATGKLVWARKLGTTSRIPSSTPTADDDRLFVLGPDGNLACLEFATGAVLWQKSFTNDFGGRMMSSRGYGESPFVDGDKLVCTPGGADAAIVALHKRSGAVLWKAKVPDIGPAGRDGAGFSSIVVTEAAGIRQYVQLMGRGLVGVDARDGRFLWGYNAISNQTANIPTPVVRNDLVFAANGYDAGSVLLRLEPDGKSGEPRPGVRAHKVYSLTGGKFQNHHGGVVLIGDHVYGGHGSNNGLPTCLNFESGQVVWKRRGPGEGSAAVLYAEGHLYFRYQNGLVALIEATPSGYRLKGTLQIPNAGGDSWSHPVVANGRLYLREKDVLWVHDLRRESVTIPSESTTAAPIPDADLLTLSKLGLTIQSLSAVRSEKARRLYRYATGAGKMDSVVLIGLTDRHLSAQGTIPDELLDRLTSQRMPLVLSLAGTVVSDAGLQQLRSLDRLVGLDLELCSRFSDAGLKPLQQFAHLRVLILAGTNVTTTGIRHLTPNKSLIALDLEVCDSIADSACEALGQMRQLKALVLKKTGFEKYSITDAGMRHLGNLSELEALNLYGNLVADAGLVHLAGSKKLRDLNLSLLAITDRGLVHLKNLSELERLELTYSEGFAGPIITDAGLQSLGGLTNLRSLNLTGARISDVGLARLHALKNLKVLQMVNTAIRPEGIRAFAAALPDCEVIK